MLSYETISAFMLAALLLSLAPGPDNIFVLIQSALHGRCAGIIVTCGLCTGLVIHALAVAFGVAAIFQASAQAFALLKGVGVLYLLYLAWGAFRAAAMPVTTVPALNRRGLYYRGILMSLTNPKLAIFFMAFLPQFADPTKGELSQQLLSLGGLFILVGFMVMSMFALMSGFIRQWLLDSPKGQCWVNRLAGVVFIGLAVKLLLIEK